MKISSAGDEEFETKGGEGGCELRNVSRERETKRDREIEREELSSH